MKKIFFIVMNKKILSNYMCIMYVVCGRAGLGNITLKIPVEVRYFTLISEKNVMLFQPSLQTPMHFMLIS